MPSLYGSTDYIPASGSLVLMVGFDPRGKQLQPIGVGEVDQGRVRSLGRLKATSLNYIGYALKEEAAQEIMRDYVDGRIDLLLMGARLDGLAR